MQRKVLVVEFKEPGDPPTINVRIFGTAARMEQAIIDFAAEHGGYEGHILRQVLTRDRSERAAQAQAALEAAGWSITTYAAPIE